MLPQRIKCARVMSWCLGMLQECLASSSMRLGVPFIAPRQLGAVESSSGRLILPSVIGRTGQSGAHRTLSGARFLSLNGAADRCRCGSRWRTGHVRCTPDSPVPPSDRWLGHVSRADRAADRWLTGQSGAHRTLSGADLFPILAQPTVEDLESLAHRTLSGAHRTVWCPHQTVGSATRHTRIARPTVGSPDSPMHHQTVR